MTRAITSLDQVTEGGADDDSVYTDIEAAELLKCAPQDLKRAWRRGLLGGVKTRRGLTFRLGALRTWRREEEERWRVSNLAARGSAKSPDGTPGTSTGTSPETIDVSGDAALAQEIADALKKPSASSSSNVHALKGRRST